MTTLAPDPVAQAEEQEQSLSQELFATLDAIDIPRGARAEILDGKTITVSPTPIGLHQENIHRFDEQVRAHMPDGHRSEGYLEIRMPDLGRSVIPDLFVAPREVLLTDDHCVPPDDVRLVAEVVSRGSMARDRRDKTEIYARALIEYYVLIDPIEGQVTLYSDPEGHRYRNRNTCNFGEELAIPKPFGFTLDTTGFLRYA